MSNIHILGRRRGVGAFCSLTIATNHFVSRLQVPNSLPCWWARGPAAAVAEGAERVKLLCLVPTGSEEPLQNVFPPVGSACCFKIKLVLVSKQEQDNKIKFSEECCESCVKNKPPNVFPSCTPQPAFAPL